jgi:hypothetical protein
VIYLTEEPAGCLLNESPRSERATIEIEVCPMLASIFVTLLILAVLATAFGPGAGRGLITRRPYNNRHSDATSARDEKSSLSD